MNFQCKAWYLSHRGKVRPANEDALQVGSKVVAQADMTEAVAWESSQPNAFCVCVADGMGGHKAGEQASLLCCEKLAQMDAQTDDQLQDRLEELNSAIYKETDVHPTWSGMGTTVAGLALLEEGAFAFNVGDSRVYRAEDKLLNKITTDDTLAQALQDAGVLDADGVRPPSLHGLTQALGGAKEYHDILPRTYECPLEDRATFLLCTDGLTDMLSLKRMEERLSLEKPELIVNALFEDAMDEGGKDNVTIIYIEVERGS